MQSQKRKSPKWGFSLYFCNSLTLAARRYIVKFLTISGRSTFPFSPILADTSTGRRGRRPLQILLRDVEDTVPYKYPYNVNQPWLIPLPSFVKRVPPQGRVFPFTFATHIANIGFIFADEHSSSLHYPASGGGCFPPTYIPPLLRTANHICACRFPRGR